MTELQMFSHRANHIVPPLIGGLLLNGVLLLIALPPLSQAAFTSAITPDGTLGTTVAKTGNVYDINGGTIKGSNQFHSLGLFSVGTGDIASFNGPSSIANILSRVTGGQQSMIDGTLRSTIQGANLYLMNPAGILFGPNASLDLTGSFHVTTADYLRFAEGARFYADLAQPTVLSVAPVAAFGFVSPNPTSIKVDRSTLQVPAGGTLSLVGGDIDLIGVGDTSFSTRTLSARSGRVNLASVASAGEVIPNAPDQGTDLKVDTFERLGKISLSEVAFIDAAGERGGTVVIRGGQLMIDQSPIFADTEGNVNGAPVALNIQVRGDFVAVNDSLITADSSGAGKAGDIWISAGTLELAGVPQGPSFPAFIGSRAFSTGNGGNVSVTTSSSLTVRDAASIGAHGLFGFGGSGGNLEIMAEAVTISGPKSSPAPFGRDVTGFDTGSGFFGGTAGNIQITTGTLRMTQRGAIRANSFGRGPGGDILLYADTVDVLDGSNILSVAFGSGNAGKIEVIARNVSVAGVYAQPMIDPFGRMVFNPSGIASQSGTRGGNAGDIKITTTGNLQLLDGGRLSTNTFGAGNAGNIDITAENVLIAGANGLLRDALISQGSSPVGANAGISTATASSVIGDNATGRGGDIRISTGSLDLRQEGRIEAATTGPGDAGKIEIFADRVVLASDAFISSKSSVSSHAGKAGIISIVARDSFESSDAEVTTSAERAQGGDISLTAPRIELSNGAVVSAQSAGAGNAGNIRIVAGDSFVTRNSTVTTEAIQADGGNIELQVGHLIHLIDSTLSAKVGGGSSTVGGNITVDPDFFIVERSRIIANAFQGRGGNIDMVAGVFLVDPSSVIDASSALGINGTVSIQAPVTNLSGTLAPLPQGFLQAATLLAQRCAARMGGTYSTFVVAGREGLPLEPGGLLPSPLYEAGPAGALAAAPAQEAPGAEELPMERVLVAFHEPLLPAVQGSQRLVAKGLDHGCP